MGLPRNVLVLLGLVLTAVIVAPTASAWTVELSATPQLTRTYNWTIAKSVDVHAVTLEPGQTAELHYSVTVASPGHVDSAWAVKGDVKMSSDPAITVEQVNLFVNDDVPITDVTCMPSTFPVELGLSALQCWYNAPLAGPASGFINLRATHSGGSRTAKAPFDFATAAINEVDECVAVTDTLAGSLGNVCVGDAPKTFMYTKTVGPYSSSACGEHVIDNTAAFVTNDTGATGSAAESVKVTVSCPKPCELGDYVWIDGNGDGIQNDGPEAGENGVTVELLDALGNVVATTVTADNPTTGEPGWYRFEIECGAVYRVRVAASNFAVDGPLEAKVATQVDVGADDLDSDGNPFTNTSPAVSVASGSNTTIDFGYLCPETVCPADGKFGGQLYTQLLPSGDVKLTFNQFTSFNDNSYGVNSVGWGGPDKHKFSNLTGSDKARFEITNGIGAVVLDFTLDYISCSSSIATPSKCASLGVSGGDGSIKTGSAAHILSWNTSLARDLNDHGFCSGGSCVSGGVDLLVNSPPTTGPDSYTLPAGSPFGAWNFENTYEAVISKSAFGASGFGSARTVEVHNSPDKPGASCPTTPGTLCAKGTKLSSLTLKYTGQSCSATTNLQSGKVVCSGDPAGASPVRIVVSSKDGKKVLFDSATATIAVGSEFTVTPPPDGKKSGKFESDTLVSIYAASGALVQSVQFHTSCSKPIAVGDQFGSLVLVGGTSSKK